MKDEQLCCGDPNGCGRQVVDRLGGAIVSNSSGQRLQPIEFGPNERIDPTPAGRSAGGAAPPVPYAAGSSGLAA